MQFVTEFRDPEKVRTLRQRIQEQVQQLGASAQAPIRLMEVCGGHTHTIFKFGLDQLLPEGVELIHGPGCPVCVLPLERVDAAVALAEQPSVILATFGDALRVPGSQKSLLQAKAEGADVRIVYSPEDALRLARQHPDQEVVFFALGFETTMPSTALTVLQAAQEEVRNFSILCQHITIPATLRAVLEDPDQRIDAFIGPGHVSMIIGLAPYAFIAEEFHKPLVVSGFEPLDVLQSIWMLLQQLQEQRCAVENQYRRVVPEAGNPAAQRAVEQVFELKESCAWRGLGTIPNSGVQLRPAFAAFDAEQRFSVTTEPGSELEGCQCGDVLRGHLKPAQCRMFGTRCTPEQPLGALMVSSEGACAAYYRYRSRQQAHTAVPS